MLLPVLLNLCLAALKFVGGNLSGSVSVTADALNNLTDAVTALLTMLGVKIASIIGGEKHENGHGRMEWIVAIVVSCAVVLVGWETLKSAIDAIREPADTEFHIFTLCVLLTSIGVKLFLYGYNTKKSREKNSQALKAAAADCISDAVSTAVVTVSLLANVLLHLRLDSWCGLLVALFILYNGVKSFADTAHRIVGGNGDTETKGKLRQYVLDFSGGIFTDVPELQLHDYGYDRYGVSMCVTATPSMDALEASEYAAALRSAIYRDFGFQAIIQMELPVDELEADKVRHELRMAMRRLPFQVEAEQIRVNRAKGHIQVILVAGLSFENGKNEAETTAALQSLIPADRCDLIVKLRLDHAEGMSGERRLAFVEKTGGKAMLKVSAFSDTAYPFLQDDLLERFGLSDGGKAFTLTETKYSEFLRELDAYKTDAVRLHLCAKLFPLMACYQALLERGVSAEDALQFVRGESQKVAEQKKREAQRMVKMVGAYTMFRLLVKSHMKRSFPEEGFGIDWQACNAKEIAFHMTHCIYAQTCEKHGCPELCTVFCENDITAFSGYMPKIGFERTATIGTGADVCDFRFVNLKKKSSSD